MSAPKPKGPIYDPGLCRCCGSSKKCRVLNVEYYWQGLKEIYSEMFVECFGLLLSNLDGSPEDRLICATCVVRLRDANAFRNQVLVCEEKLLKAQIQIDNGVPDPALTEVKTEPVKDEDQPLSPLSVAPEKDSTEDVSHDALDEQMPQFDSDGDIKDDGIDDVDYIPESPPKKTEVKEKRKRGRPRKHPLKEKKKHSKGKKDLLKRMKEVSEKLKEMGEYEEVPLIEMIPRKKEKIVDDDQKAFTNTVKIVQNSYVCPFDTSFSDYFCLYCREVYTDPVKLREHTMTHDPSNYEEYIANKKLPQIDIMRIDCRLCNENIMSIDILKYHLTTTHNIEFYELSNEFLAFRLTIKNLTCLECGNSFQFFHALKKHMAEHFGKCTCDICGAHYFEERMLILHQKTHRRVEETFSCNQCGKLFKSKNSRNAHVNRTHNKEPQFECSKCDAVLLTYGLRYRHMIQVHGEQRVFPCEHCDRSYDSRKSLREHVRRSHLKIFKHQCETCEKRFYLPSRLKEHMVTHTGERSFRCDYCGKCYPRLRGLKVHMQSHVSEKKYKCVLCNASFTQNVNLKNHMKRQHQSLEEGYHE